MVLVDLDLDYVDEEASGEKATLDPVDLDVESPPVTDSASDTVSSAEAVTDETDSTIQEIQKPSASTTVSRRNNVKKVVRRTTNKLKSMVLPSTQANINSRGGGSSNGSTHSKMTAADSTSSEISFLKDELYKLRKESRMFKANVEKEFKGVKNYSTSTVTQFGMYWIIAVSLLLMAVLYGYIIVRAIRGSTTTFDALYVYSGYCGLYIVYFIMDVFWNTVRPDRVLCKKNTDHTHVMVAAHRAEESLVIMLPQVLQSFEPHAVWVCDNGYYDGGRTRELCERLGVNYRYNKTGNKANALLATGREIERDCPEVKNVVLLDDDTEMPSDFFVRHDLLAKDRVAGYCVGIGVKRSPRFNLWEVAIDYEYRQISHSYGARAASSTSWFLHGICAVYRLDKFFEIFEDNWSMPGGVPFGEDGYAGITARQKGYRLLQDNHNLVHTFCPDRFFPPCGKGGRVQGYGANSLWKQRACRWYLSWPRAFGSEIHLFFTYKAGSVLGNVQYRLYVLWRIFLDVVGVIWIPYFCYILFIDGSWNLYFLLKGMLVSTSILSTICRILVFPRKLRRGIHPMAPFVTPIFTFGSDFLRFCSFFICMFWYVPFVRIGDLKFYENSNPEPEITEDDAVSYYDFGAPVRESKSVTAASASVASSRSKLVLQRDANHSEPVACNSSIASNESYEFESNVGIDLNSDNGPLSANCENSDCSLPEVCEIY